MSISGFMTSALRRIYRRRLLSALRRIDGLGRDKKGQLNLVKRTRRIKLAADLCLALTSHGTAWSQALIKKHTSQLKRDKRLVKEIMGKKRFNDVIKIERNAYYSQHQQEGSHGLTGVMRKYMKARMITSRNTIHKIIHRKNAVNIPVRPSAYKLALNERTRQLKKLIPGGESMNSSSLLREAADYIVSLRTQVQVMHSLTYHSKQAV
jgi:hypothetical protein